MKAVVMAGGEGSRLRPITANRPKPLVPVGNRPIMEHILLLLARHGIKNVVSTLHYLADEIMSYFDDGSDLGIKMQYSIEDSPLGTAGSVKKAEALLRDGPFLIISGDALTDCDLTKAIEFHRKKGSLATLILYRVPNPLEFGVVITDSDDRVIRFLEKPSWSEVFSDTVNTGMYILEPEVLDMMEPGKQYDWSRDIFPQILRDGKPIYGYVMEEYWCDVGTLNQYRDAQEHLLSGRTSLDISGEVYQPGVYVGPHSVIEEGAVVTPPTCIGRNCKIKSGARIGPYTVIGDNSLIEHGATVERSVVWDTAYIGPSVGIHSAILGSKVTIKRDSVVREDAVVGDRCLIDVGCVIRPRIKLWPDKVIERGSTVTMSLVWGNKWRGTLFRELGVAGLSNIEITPDFASRLGSAFGTTLANGATVITGRDSSRSSRMLKRALMASLLSVGLEVLDMRSTALPVLRHFTRGSGAAGAVYVRKIPGNRRVTSIEFFDEKGMYLSRSKERKVESAFFREDFHRVDPDDLGYIEFASRALEEYQTDFNRLVEHKSEGKRMKLMLDFGYSNIASIYPSMLARLNVEALNSNSINDARLAPRTPEDIERHSASLRHIVGTLGYDMGVLFLNEGEQLILIDDLGRVIESASLLGVFASLIAQTEPQAKIALNVTASERLQEHLTEMGAQVLRTKADVRSLESSAVENNASFAGDHNGGVMFPKFHAGFDAMFGLAALINMLQTVGKPLSEVLDELPPINMSADSVRCPWETKGSVMRKLTEAKYPGAEVDQMDGIKVKEGDEWVLILPDSVEPLFHIYTEAGSRERSREIASHWVQRLTEMQ